MIINSTVLERNNDINIVFRDRGNNNQIQTGNGQNNEQTNEIYINIPFHQENNLEIQPIEFHKEIEESKSNPDHWNLNHTENIIPEKDPDDNVNIIVEEIKKDPE